jgi:hypothetical protein
MTYPKDIKIIDTMLGIPTHADRSDWYSSFRPLLNDQQSRDMFKMPAQYMFKDIPEPSSHEADFVTWTIKADECP